jgi:hypothetical protein
LFTPGLGKDFADQGGLKFAELGAKRASLKRLKSNGGAPPLSNVAASSPITGENLKP